jgi:hypothetical protein
MRTNKSKPAAPVPSELLTGIPASAIELAQRGRLILPSQEPDVSWMRLPIGEPVAGASLVQALLDERDSSR